MICLRCNRRVKQLITLISYDEYAICKTCLDKSRNVMGDLNE